MKSTVDLAIKRHDIDASHFQSVYSKSENQLTKKEKAFITGRKMVLKELEALLASIPKGSKVLDIGCGTAHLTHWIKEKGFEVYGIEPSEDMYNYAVKNFPDINIVRGVGSQLPYENNSFDLVVAFEVLRYIDPEENEKVYKEVHRVLKKDGQFFITQVNLFSTDMYYFFYAVKEIYSKMTNKIHHFCNFTTSGKEIDLVKRIGFSSVRTVGVYDGSIRFAYKISKGVGDAVASVFTKIFSQRTESPFLANFKAHLLVIGKK